MGAEPYWYCIAYQTDTNTTLQALRQREFAAGRYNPIVPFIDFPITDSSPTPGAQHSSIEEALEPTFRTTKCSTKTLPTVVSI